VPVIQGLRGVPDVKRKKPSKSVAITCLVLAVPVLGGTLSLL
jgi:hypothetical protein